MCESFCREAAACGDTELLAWLRSEGCPWSEATSAAASNSGHIGTFLWMITQHPPCPWSLPCPSIAPDDTLSGTSPKNTKGQSWLLPVHKHMKLLQGIEQHRASVAEKDSQAQQILDSLSGEVLGALREAASARPWQVMSGVAASGHVAAMTWLLQGRPGSRTGLTWDARNCAAAAGAGQVAMLPFLRSQGDSCPWDASVCAAAAQEGRITMLEVLRSQDPPCPWDEQCGLVAVGNNQ